MLMIQELLVLTPFHAQECLQRAVNARGVVCSTLHVDPTNEAAKLLYLGMGFTCDRILKDYYGLSRPCWMMTKEL